MLDAGFQPLTWLKARLMPDAGDQETEWDDKLATIGLAVARSFNGLTGRTLEREVGAVDEFEAYGISWTLRRYPIEEVTEIACVDPAGSTSEIAVSDFRIRERSGLLELTYPAGSRDETLRVTYTGGYWLDPQDGTPKPAEATAMPDDLLEAWVAQCQHVAEVRAVFSDAAMRREGSSTDLVLLDHVREVLRPYRRIGGE